MSEKKPPTVLGRASPWLASAFFLACSGGSDAKASRFEVALVEGALGLKGPSDFAGIEDEKERSQALFVEASRVFSHPRCVNCHPGAGVPLQGDDSHPHIPPVKPGTPVMYCFSCHQSHNVEHAGVPGAPHWDLAPSSMSWEGRSPKEICEQLKDRRRNANLNLEEIVEHNATDELVAWGWEPGPGRSPAPGSQAIFASLVRAWVDTGAHCPDADARPAEAGDSATRPSQPLNAAGKPKRGSPNPAAYPPSAPPTTDRTEAKP